MSVLGAIEFTAQVGTKRSSESLEVFEARAIDAIPVVERIHECRMNAGGAPAFDVRGIEIAHVKRTLRASTGCLEGVQEKSRIGFLETHDVRIENRVEIRSESLLFENPQNSSV